MPTTKIAHITAFLPCRSTEADYQADTPMLDPVDVLEAVGPDLDAARAKIEAVRDRLQSVLDGEGEELAEIGHVVARLARLAEDVLRVEEAIGGQAVGA